VYSVTVATSGASVLHDAVAAESKYVSPRSV